MPLRVSRRGLLVGEIRILDWSIVRSQSARQGLFSQHSGSTLALQSYIKLQRAQESYNTCTRHRTRLFQWLTDLLKLGLSDLLTLGSATPAPVRPKEGNDFLYRRHT